MTKTEEAAQEYSTKCAAHAAVGKDVAGDLMWTAVRSRAFKEGAAWQKEKDAKFIENARGSCCDCPNNGVQFAAEIRAQT